MTKIEWVDVNNCVPLVDGEYMVQTVFGDIMSIMYTVDGGWNSFIDNRGVLHAEGNESWNNGYVVRWLCNMPKPDAVPEERYEAYWKWRGAR